VRSIRLRLVQRIYLVGIVQFVIVAIGIVVLAREPWPPALLGDATRYIADELSAQSGTPESLAAAVLRVRDDLHCAIAVYDSEDRLLVAAGQPIGRPSTTQSPDRHPSNELGSGLVPLALRGRGTGRLVYVLPTPPLPLGLGFAPILALFVVGISSWLTARSLAKPLAHLTRTANAFGSGNLLARAGMKRSDELGDMANAFDDMAERVTKSIRAERELLANISHELRTPLQRIHIALDLATEGDAATARESLCELSEDLEELERLVEDILTATMLALKDGATASSAVPPTRAECVEIRALIDRAAARFRVAYPGRRLELSVDESLMVTGDPVTLRRVIDNLLENAHKYTDVQDNPITVSGEMRLSRVVIEVRDQGIGISAADLERVCEPFFRADRSRTRATGGLGLGLALARRIVEAHGGELSLESVVGQGTTARVCLPSRTTGSGSDRMRA
jgi:two-component system, OmpR family, sensor kinase